MVSGTCSGGWGGSRRRGKGRRREGKRRGGGEKGKRRERERGGMGELALNLDSIFTLALTCRPFLPHFLLAICLPFSHFLSVGLSFRRRSWRERRGRAVKRKTREASWRKMISIFCSSITKYRSSWQSCDKELFVYKTSHVICYR